MMRRLGTLLALGSSISRAWSPNWRVTRLLAVEMRHAEAVNETVAWMAPHSLSWIPPPPRPDTSSTKTASSSAFTHVGAILDLYENDCVGGDLALSTLQALVDRCCAPSAASIDADALDRLEQLVWRLPDVDLAPSVGLLENLWDLQGQLVAEAKPSQHVGRRVQLLRHWYQWAWQGAVPCPDENRLIEILEYAMKHRVTMSYTTWDLYRELGAHDSVPRAAYPRLLALLGRSSTTWQVRQGRVIGDMMAVGTDPTAEELLEVLASAAGSGRAQDAAWMLRLLHDRQSESSILDQAKPLFLQSIVRSCEAGSATYLERLVLTDEWNFNGNGAYRLLLRKWAHTKQRDAGQRATAVLEHMQRQYQQTLDPAWKPDAQCVYSVVLAILQGNTTASMLERVQESDALVRNSVSRGHLAEVCVHGARSRVFDRLLDAYSECEDARDLADECFQYYLIAHRQGLVGEAPDRFHLGHILRVWNRESHSRTAADKSFEYYCILERLAATDTKMDGPDIFNTRQLLGTLAKSEQSGHGATAEALLREAVLAQPRSVDPHALGHMYWCVVKCYCQEGLDGIMSALSIVDDLEQRHADNSSSVRVTGAVYQTMIGALAGIDHHLAPTLVEEVVNRLEQQHTAGNKRAQLTEQFYRDALQCCERNNAGELAAVCRKRMDQLSTENQ